MKTKLMTVVCAVAFSLATATPSFAGTTPDPGAVVLDFAVTRPCCLAVTAVGAVFFIVTLPVSAATKSVKATRRALVDKPAKMTFKRPLGDLDALME